MIYGKNNLFQNSRPWKSSEDSEALEPDYDDCDTDLDATQEEGDKELKLRIISRKYMLLNNAYLVIDLDVNLALLQALANQRREFIKILHYDWLTLKVRQDLHRGRLVYTVVWYIYKVLKRWLLLIKTRIRIKLLSNERRITVKIPFSGLGLILDDASTQNFCSCVFIADKTSSCSQPNINM